MNNDHHQYYFLDAVEVVSSEKKCLDAYMTTHYKLDCIYHPIVYLEPIPKLSFYI